MTERVSLQPVSGAPVAGRFEAPATVRLPVVRALCAALEVAWARGLLTKPVLDADWLTAEAARREGRDPSPGDWQQALCHLVTDLNGQARLNPLGTTIARTLLLRTIRQRIRAETLWRAHPEIRDVPIDAPVIVLGQMRSGTTLLHRLLACDAQFAHTTLSESIEPVTRSRSLAIAGTAITQTMLSLCNPSLRRIHPTSATSPEEEFGLHAFSFHGAMFEAQWHVPAFAAFNRQRNLTPVYRDFRQLIQTLRWRQGDWTAIQLMKAPQFMQDLAAVLDAFPGARIVRIARNPTRVAASSASLVWHQRRIQSDHADPAKIGAEWRQKMELRNAAAAEALASRPHVPVLALDYDAMEADWLAEIRTVYEFLGLPLADAIVRRMTRVANSRAHRGHHYCSRQFGLA